MRPLTNLIAANLDEYAQRYLDAVARVEVIKEQLLYVCRQRGFTPKDAPKTKMLAGALYEVLASRATRTVLHQRRLAALRNKLYWKNLRRFSRALVRARIVYDVAQGAERAVASMPAWVRLGFAAAVQTRPGGTRLTVRKKKVAGSRLQVAGRKKVA